MPLGPAGCLAGRRTSSSPRCPSVWRSSTFQFSFLHFVLNQYILFMKVLLMLIIRRVCTVKIQQQWRNCFVSDYWRYKRKIAKVSETEELVINHWRFRASGNVLFSVCSKYTWIQISTSWNWTAVVRSLTSVRLSFTAVITMPLRHRQPPSRCLQEAFWKVTHLISARRSWTHETWPPWLYVCFPRHNISDIWIARAVFPICIISSTYEVHSFPFVY